MSLFKPSRDLDYLFPKFKRRVLEGLRTARKDGFDVDVFEGYRTPERSDYLYEQGRSRLGDIITNASAWMSWHNYGLAVDLVMKENGIWTWDGDYKAMSGHFLAVGLEWGGPWDGAHFQMDEGLTIAQANRIRKKQGILWVWREVWKRAQDRASPKD